MLLCHNRNAARGAQAPVTIYDNLDYTTGGIAMSNTRAFDIYDNTFDGGSDALYIGYGCPTSTTVGDHHIYGNTFLNASSVYPGGPWPAILFAYYGSGSGMTFLPSTIEENSFEGNDVGVGYQMDSDITYPADVISFNSFENNTDYAIQVWGAYATTVNAECNWYGDATGPGPVGPGAGDNVSTNVDYDPWLTTLDLSGTDSDGDGVAAACGDCDDNDPNNYPGNTEVCDGGDNDCDGLIDGSDPDYVGAPDFDVTAVPAVAGVTWFMGLIGTATYDVTVSSVDCFDSMVSLSVTGLPGGTRRYHFVPSDVVNVPPRSSATVQLVVEVTRQVLPGNYPLTITGDDGATTHGYNVTLQVTRPPRFGGRPLVAKAGGVPEAYVLEQNHPNPFNPETSIDFGLPDDSQVKVTVYNTLGQVVQTLVDEELDAGYYTVSWDAAGLPTGVYFYRIVADNFTETRRMVYMK